MGHHRISAVSEISGRPIEPTNVFFAGHMRRTAVAEFKGLEYTAIMEVKTG
jgi:hypothetical protein